MHNWVTYCIVHRLATRKITDIWGQYPITLEESHWIVWILLSAAYFAMQILSKLKLSITQNGSICIWSTHTMILRVLISHRPIGDPWHTVHFHLNTQNLNRMTKIRKKMKKKRKRSQFWFVFSTNLSQFRNSQTILRVYYVVLRHYFFLTVAIIFGCLMHGYL